MPRVRFIASAQWRGLALRRGTKIQMDEQTAAAYIRAGQAVLDDSIEDRDEQAAAAKPAADRETAAKPAREKRTQKAKGED